VQTTWSVIDPGGSSSPFAPAMSKKSTAPLVFNSATLAMGSTSLWVTA
jgi:hypothetical protein